MQSRNWKNAGLNSISELNCCASDDDNNNNNDDDDDSYLLRMIEKALLSYIVRALFKTKLKGWWKESQETAKEEMYVDPRK